MLKRLVPNLKSDTLAQSVVVAMVLAVICRMFAFGRGVLLVRTLDPAELGTWALMSNAVGVLAFFAALGIPNGLSRYAQRHQRAGTLRRFLAETLLRSLGIAALICLGGLLLWQPLGNALFAEASALTLVAVTLATILATVAFSVVQGALHGLRLFRLNSLVELLQHMGFLLLVVVLLIVWRDDVLAPAFALLIVTLLVTAVVGVWMFGALSSNAVQVDDPPDTAAASSPGRSAWWTLVVFSLGTWSAGSLQAVWRGLDRYMLLHLGNLPNGEALDQIGQYFIASKLGQPLSVLAGLLSMILLPHAARLWEQRRHGEVGSMVRLTAKLAALGMTLTGAVLLVLKPLWLTVIAGHVPLYASLVLGPVLLTIVAVSLHYIVRTYLLCGERAWSIGGVWAVALVVNIGLNAWLIPQYQLYGAAIATMASAALAAIAVVVLAARQGLAIDRGMWFSMLLPVALLLPDRLMLAAIGAALLPILFTNSVLTVAEKQRVNQWCGQRMSRLLDAAGGFLPSRSTDA